MRTCPDCRNPIPDIALACAICMRAKYLHELRQTEIELLPKIAAGGILMKFLKDGRAKLYHIGYQNGFSLQPYCHAQLRAPRHTHGVFTDRPKNLCPNCVSTLNALLTQAGVKTGQ